MSVIGRAIAGEAVFALSRLLVRGSKALALPAAGAMFMARAVAGIGNRLHRIHGPIKSAQAGEKQVELAIEIPRFCRGLRFDRDQSYEVRNVVKIDGTRVLLDAPLMHTYPPGTKALLRI